MADEIPIEVYSTLVNIAIELKKKCSIYFDRKNFLSLRLALDIIYDNYRPEEFTGDNRGYIVIDDDDADIYFYRDGVYIDGEPIVRTLAQMVLGDKITNQRCSEVVGAVKRVAQIRVKREQLNNYTNLINLKNGIFNTETGELLSHDKKYYFTNKMDIVYNKDAKCPVAIKFFEGIHKAEDIPIIQEMFGYCMYPSYEYNKIFFLIGTGRNGKSTELGLIRKFIGSRNISSATIHDLIENQFNSAQLFGKLANISGDVGMEAIEDTSIIKRLSGGDSIMAQHKFGHQFEFINYAKLIYACNNPPDIKDRSNAIWNRMIHITFPNTFLDTDANTDPHIIDKLTTQDELSGLFNWAMEGLKRLKQNGKFSYSKTCEENMKAYDRKANPILAFVDETCEEADGSEVETEVVYQAHVLWCRANKIPVISKSWFSKRLKEALPMCYVMKRQPSHDAEKVPVYMNLRLKNEQYTMEQLDSVKPKEEVIQSPQQKLSFQPSLADQIEGLRACIEMHNDDMSIEDLNNEGFDDAFIEKCIEQKIIFKKPNGNVGLC